MTAKKQNRLVHSVPTWICGPRPANAKFGGGDPNAGRLNVSDRLAGIKELSTKLEQGGVIQHPLLSSFHVGLEVLSDVEGAGVVNKEHAISYDSLRRGIRDGICPRVLALTAPAFGFPGVEQGSVFSPDASRVELAFRMHQEGLRRTVELASEGLGEGRYIWWPAFDSLALQNMGPNERISNTLIPQSEQWSKMHDFALRLLRSIDDGVISLEFKPGDPGVDIIPTLELAMRFCKEVNGELGRKGMMLNNEWAHLLASGISITEGTRQTIAAGLFDGFVHVNSGQQLNCKLSTLLKNSIHPADLPVLMDWDWRVGVGSPKLLADQAKAARALRMWSNLTSQTVFAEHDLHHFGTCPFAYAEDSIRSLELMWVSKK